MNQVAEIIVGKIIIYTLNVLKICYCTTSSLPTVRVSILH